MHFVRLSSMVMVAFVLAGVSSRGWAAGADDGVMVMESAAGAGGPAGCNCGPQAAFQQPPWHGNVRASQSGMPSACCRGSNVFQAHPFEQLAWKHKPCVVMPPRLPRLHTLCREGYLPSPVPPAFPRCHQCGAPIEGGF